MAVPNGDRRGASGGEMIIIEDSEAFGIRLRLAAEEIAKRRHG